MLKKMRSLFMALLLTSATPLMIQVCRAEENGISEDDINKILQEVKPDPIEEPQNSNSEPKDLTTWQKIQVFWSIPFSLKKDIVKEHILENKAAYSIGFLIAAGSIVGIVLYFKKRNLKSSE
jgi:hypothetical protein